MPTSLTISATSTGRRPRRSTVASLISIGRLTPHDDLDRRACRRASPGRPETATSRGRRPGSPAPAPASTVVAGLADPPDDLVERLRRARPRPPPTPAAGRRCPSAAGEQTFAAAAVGHDDQPDQGPTVECGRHGLAVYHFSCHALERLQPVSDAGDRVLRPRRRAGCRGAGRRSRTTRPGAAPAPWRWPPSGAGRRCSRWPPSRTTSPRAGTPGPTAAAAPRPCRGTRVVSGSSQHEARHRLVLARQRRQVGHEERVGQEAHVEHDVRLGRHAVLEPERQQRHRQVALAAAVALLDQRPQHVHGQRRRCRPPRRPPGAAGVSVLALGARCRPGCRCRTAGGGGASRRSGACRISSRASRNSTSTRVPGLAQMSAKIAARPCQELAARARRCPAPARSMSARADSSSMNLRHQRQRQVVDAQ